MPYAAHTSAAILCMLTILTSGCSRNTVVGPTASDSNGLIGGRDAGSARNDFPPGGGWYPMAAGNQWRYRGHSFTEVTAAGGTRDTVVDSHFELAIDQLGGSANLDEFYERWTETFPTGTAKIIKPFRQTRDGLWETVATNPLREIHWLAYPLHVGQTWLQGVLFVSNPRMTVEAEETLRTPVGNIPAWRIRIDRPTQGPNDFDYVWFGRAGYLQRVSHSESVLADGSIVRSDHTHFLQSIRIAGPGRFAGPNLTRPSAAPLSSR